MDIAEDQNIRREIFEVIDMNRASLLTGFKKEYLIIMVVVASCHPAKAAAAAFTGLDPFFMESLERVGGG